MVNKNKFIEYVIEIMLEKPAQNWSVSKLRRELIHRRLFFDVANALGHEYSRIDSRVERVERGVYRLTNKTPQPIMNTREDRTPSILNFFEKETHGKKYWKSSEIANKIGGAKHSVQTGVSRLARNGVLERKKKNTRYGTTHYYYYLPETKESEITQPAPLTTPSIKQETSVSKAITQHPNSDYKTLTNDYIESLKKIMEANGHKENNITEEIARLEGVKADCEKQIKELFDELETLCKEEKEHERKLRVLIMIMTDSPISQVKSPELPITTDVLDVTELQERAQKEREIQRELRKID